MTSIQKIRPVQVERGNWEVIAYFDARFGDFLLKDGALKRSKVDGSYVVSLNDPESKFKRRISLLSTSATRDSIVAAAVKAWKDAVVE